MPDPTKGGITPPPPKSEPEETAPIVAPKPKEEPEDK